MAWGGFGDVDVDEEENDQQAGAYYATKDCLILLIDCSQGMFVKSEDGSEVPFELCIKCARSVLSNKIISSEKDLVGIVFYGTELDMPDAPRIKQLEEILEDDNGFAQFKNTYGHSSNFSLSDVFWTCSTMLATSGTKYSHRRILLFTNNDDPHASNMALQRQAKTKAKDLAENGIEVELMHLGKDFSVSKFYQDIIFSDDDDGVTVLPDPSEKFEELLTRVRSKEYKKRAMQRVTLSLGPGLELGVGMYCMVRETRKPSFVRLAQRTNEELKTKTTLLCADTGTTLLPTDIKYYQLLSGERVIFEKEEVDEIKKFGKPGFTLMGFKPRASLKIQNYIKPANFIYPDESTVTGSTKLFAALLKRCLARDVVAICKCVPRSNSSPIFVALKPQEEELDDNNMQISPPGFHVIFLPFTEDVRKVSFPETAEASNEQIDKAKEVIKKLSFKFQSESFENPVLQKHYRTLEALALDHEEVEEFSDLTQPDTARINRRAGTAIADFIQSVGISQLESRGTKRKADEGSGATNKRPKRDNGPVNVEELARNKTLSKLTVPVLKEYLVSQGKKVAGRKQDYIDAINEYLGLQ